MKDTLFVSLFLVYPSSVGRSGKGSGCMYAPLTFVHTPQSNEMKQMALGCHGNLCFMDLSDNHLASVQGLGHTPQLLHLNLSGNRMARVAGVTACPLLQGLNLDSNLLINTKVPMISASEYSSH